MSDKELEITHSVINLAQEMQHDRMRERELSDLKNKRQMVVNIVLIIAFSIILMYDIHESYSEVSIQNTSTAVSERRETNE